MTRMRLIIACLFSVLGSSAWSGALHASEGRIDERVNVPAQAHRQEKFAGRATNLSAVNDAENKNANSQYPVHAQEVREKKSLSKEERRALRRQINETETKYPRKN